MDWWVAVKTLAKNRWSQIILAVLVGAGATFYLTEVRADSTAVYTGTGGYESTGSFLLGMNYKFGGGKWWKNVRVGAEIWKDNDDPQTVSVTQGARHGDKAPVTLTGTASEGTENGGVYACWSWEWKYAYVCLGGFLAANADTVNISRHFLGYASAAGRLPVNDRVALTLGWWHKSDWFGPDNDEDHFGPGVDIRF